MAHSPVGGTEGRKPGSRARKSASRVGATDGRKPGSRARKPAIAMIVAAVVVAIAGSIWFGKPQLWFQSSGSLTQITGFGPSPVVQGQPFNVQPDGSSAIWVRTAKTVVQGSKIRLADVILNTVLEGTLLTAIIPVSAVDRVGKLPLRIVAPDGSARSDTVEFEVVAPSR